MGTLVSYTLIAVLLGIGGRLLGPLLLVLLTPRKHCRHCEASMPKLPTTWNSRKVVWTCPLCGYAVNVRGRKVEE